MASCPKLVCIFASRDKIQPVVQGRELLTPFAAAVGVGGWMETHLGLKCIGPNCQELV